MNSNPDLTDQAAHFAFGKNWAEYAAKISDTQITHAQQCLCNLVGNTSLRSKRFLDIGSGSGVHVLAAINLGATEVVAMDIDPDSVATTQALLEKHANPKVQWQSKHASVFDLSPAEIGNFDVVYSWGVLHHTGQMVRAIRTAADLVAKDGLFVFALYRRVLMDPFWKFEKRWYAKASLRSQRRAQAIFIVLSRLRMRLTGHKFDDMVAQYTNSRGMDYFHDIHDWLGGFPYESISTTEVAALMADLGFSPVRIIAQPVTFLSRLGLLGSGCDEFVYRRVR